MRSSEDFLEQRIEKIREQWQNISWIKRVILFASLTLILYETVDLGSSIEVRALESFLFFILLPFLFLKLNGKSLDFSIDRTTLIYTGALCTGILPFYLLAGSVPSIRTFYPIGISSTAPSVFIIYQLKQFFLALGTEIFYRGVLCVWIRDIGPKSIFVSPLVYAYQHLGKPSLEVVASAPADVVFGYFDYRSESIIPSVTAHWFGMIITDWACLHDPLFPAAGMIIQNFFASLL